MFVAKCLKYNQFIWDFQINVAIMWTQAKRFKSFSNRSSPTYLRLSLLKRKFVMWMLYRFEKRFGLNCFLFLTVAIRIRFYFLKTTPENDDTTNGLQRHLIWKNIIKQNYNVINIFEYSKSTWIRFVICMKMMTFNLKSFHTMGVE